MPSPRTLANALRVLSMDAVQKASSGHPGAPMGMADIAEVLWRHYLKHDPNTPEWCNRDRFILSNGHASMLLYSLLHLTGYALPLEQLQQFRQLHSQTPGHPEFGITPGVETTTGPLGQGLGNAVGMALAEKCLAATFNREDFPIVDHYTYVFVGDGCLMEGVSHEVSSLAGTLGLHKLIVFWDDNGISIDGKVEGWFTENIPLRFRAYGWNVIEHVDGHDANDIHKAIESARLQQEAPTLICCRTTIGFGAPTLAGTEECHGAPLGEKEVQAARVQLEWPHASFVIPEEIQKAWDAREQGAQSHAQWQKLFQNYQAAYPDLAKEFERRLKGALPEATFALFTQLLSKTQEAGGAIATRKASQNVLLQLCAVMPELLGGSADLTGSNLTKVKSNEHCYMHYGVREFGMGTIMNGLALHRGFIPYGGTFLTFIDYAKNALRLAALMEQRVIWVLTHDSIGLGEDGPTHQPIEHLMSLRMMPMVRNWRPADAVETVAAWQQALFYQGPTCLILSRQNLPTLKRNNAQLLSIEKGAYIVYEPPMEPQVILLATGSEVHLCVEAAERLGKEDLACRVVSMPCWEQFEQQPLPYRQQVLGSRVLRIAVEAGSTLGWHRYCERAEDIIGIDRFGASAPLTKLFPAYGITVEKIVEKARSKVHEYSFGN